MTQLTKGFVLMAAACLFLSTPLWADMAQIKIYKEAFPDEKPKCIGCHLDEKPKKEGSHELNEFGKKVRSLATAANKEKPDAEIYKQAGKIANP